MKNQTQSKKSGRLKMLQLVHTLFCGAVLLFAFIALSAQRTTYFSIRFDEGGQLFLVFPVLVLITLFAGMRLFTFMMKGVTELRTAEEKLTRYSAAFLVQMSLFEAAGLANTVLFLKTGNYLFLAFAGVALVAMFSVRPAKKKITEQLNLSAADTATL